MEDNLMLRLGLQPYKQVNCDTFFLSVFKPFCTIDSGGGRTTF